MKIRPLSTRRPGSTARGLTRVGDQLDLLGWTSASTAGESGAYAARPLAAELRPEEPRGEQEGARVAGVRATGLKPEELCQPWSYMVEADAARALAKLEGMADRHAAELAQWHANDGVTPTMGVLLALMRPLHGVPGPKMPKGDRRRLYGLGFQVPLRWLERYSGRHRATVCRALSLCVERGLLARYSNVRKVSRVTARREVPLASVVTRDGVERSSVNVHGVLYLTPKGAAWLDRRGTTSADLGDRNPRLHGRRGQVRVGLLWAVQSAFRRVARWVARRFASSRGDATPEEEAPRVEESLVVVRAVENGPSPPGGAVSPAATAHQTGTGGPYAPARGRPSASATPPGLPARTTRRDGFYPAGLTQAGAAGGGAFSRVGGGVQSGSSGPPTHWGPYLDRETDRCWTRHVQVEGGPDRRVRVPVGGIGGLNYGDSREELRPGRVWTWSPALTAAEAYPVEWARAGKGPAGDVIRRTLTVRFGELLGRRLRLRFAEWEGRRRAGQVTGCPLEGCDCLSAELARAAPAVPARAGSPASFAHPAVPTELEQVQRVTDSVLAWAAAHGDELAETQLANRVEAVAVAAAALKEASSAAVYDFSSAALHLLEALTVAGRLGQALRDDAAGVRWRRAHVKGGAPAALLDALRDAESMGTTLAAWCRTAVAQLERTVASTRVVPRSADEAQRAWGKKLEALATQRRGTK